MMLSSSRRKAEEFARAVHSAPAVRSRSLGASLAVVAKLRALEPVDIDQAFQAELRAELMAAARSVKLP
jgi:hypothetical protein